MKRIIFIFIAIVFSQMVVCQDNVVNTDSLSINFDEIKAATKKYYSLWDRDLYGSLILIDPDTRKIYANEQDSLGVLVKNGDTYEGTLPANFNFANTVVNWNGKNWAMVMLPLDTDRYARVNLMAHELFHLTQPELGFTMHNADNGHLDGKDGRIYLRLELEALKKSICAKNEIQKKEHLTNAFIFRKYRYRIFPKSRISENELELNEGIAEYTGQVISGRTREQAAYNLIKNFDSFMDSPTFVRSFAYQTTPAYGFLLRERKKDWNKRISRETNLIDFFIKEFEIVIPENIDEIVAKVEGLYNSRQIVSEETSREEKRLQLVAMYKEVFIDQPHLVISLKKMNISFNPTNVVPLEDFGNVYPTANVSDDWGLLTVNNGMLLSSDWKMIHLSKPFEITESRIVGDGWIIDLKDGYKIIQDTGNYLLVKDMN